MYRVETHDNSKEYFSGVAIEKDAFYITATNALSKMMGEVSKTPSEELWRITDIDSFIKSVYLKWTDTLNELKIKAEIRKIIIRLRIEKKEERIQRELNFLEDNLGILFSDIGFIAEAGIRELTYRSASTTLEVFKIIYNELIATELFAGVSKELLNTSSVRAFESRITGNKGSRIHKVYVYNLNYLDLKRYLVLELLKLAGYEVIFRIPYFKGLKVINKCWDMVYRSNALFDWKEDSKGFEGVADTSKFIAFLEGRDTILMSKEAVATKTYNEISEFRKDMKGKKVITFYKDSLKPCIVAQGNPIGEHCYQSPLGRFLLGLYQCEVKGNTVSLDFSTYRELITSGWIEHRGWNGTKLSEYLTQNEAYFNDINTIDDILERISKIREIEEVNEIFEEPVKARIKKDNRKRFLSNPFRAFGYVNLEKYNITAAYFESVTIRLKSFILKALEAKEGLIDIVVHLELLRTLFRNNYIADLHKNGSDLDKKIINRIWTAINSKALEGSFHKEEIQELFNILLTFKEAKGMEEKGQEEWDLSIDHMEGLLLRDKTTNYHGDKAIYISDLSYKAYETYIQSKRISGKVLKNEDFGMIFEASLEGEHKRIVQRGFALHQASGKAAESYLKFAVGNLFINFDGKKEFSWIAGFRDNDDKSILFKQIEALYENDIKIKQELDFTDLADESEMFDLKEKAYDRKSLQSGFATIPEVAYRDLDFCDKKFLFSTILEDHPMYYTEFHQKLALAGIVSMLKNSFDDSYSSIGKFIFPLFPQWLEVVKDNILTCEYARRNMREYKYFDGINYPKTMDVLYLLKSKYIVTENSKIRNRYNKGDFKAEKYFEEFLKEYLTNESHNNGLHCKMCPHVYVCRKGDFAIDNQ